MILRLRLSRWALGVLAAASTSLGGLLCGTPPGADANRGGGPSCCAVDEPATTPAAPTAADTSARPRTIPDTALIDQHGRPVRFYTDLVKGRVVAINFIFTECRTICPTLGMNFGELRRLLGGAPVQLISVSLAPSQDRPARLAEWADRYGSGPNWTLVTGEKPEVDSLLKSLGAFVVDKKDHSPLLLLVDDRTGIWRRLDGFTDPQKVAREIRALARAGEAASAGDDPRGRSYFTDVPLVNQYGETMRFYSDVLRGKVVVIHVFFGECSGSCPSMLATYQKLQAHLGDRLGRNVHLVSLTVEPERDRWQVLGERAARLQVRRGWYLLTGTEENVGLALRKLGQAVERREEHSNLFIVGNEPTGLWKKVQGLAPAEQIIEVIDGVIADRGGDARP